MALSKTSNLQSNKLRGPSLRLELELTPPKDSPRIAASFDEGDAAIEAGSSSTADKANTPKSPAGQPARPFPDSFYRPRFIVLPTGRTMLAWGIWDCQKNPLGSLPTCIFKMSDFVHRTRSLGKAYAFARRLNEKHERKAAA